MKKNKYKLLKKGIVYDLIGMASMVIPVVGPFLDIIWAPYAAKKMLDMYPGKKGKIASVITFIEEIIPGTDIIPSFTIMWLYTFVINKEEVFDKDGKTIEVEIVQ
ncbi:hypothetical protein J8L88_03420 [Aquimarina sp. MMG015]|uniref:hypothetical protein n=1 Tax=Aquimarina TaxID=290174 RepID=UPI0004125ACB|nr:MULTISPECIES: hypothetical protein [Aquimarina]AXT54940.1 hypothetical protein D1815_03915 [Aquimarina sp. AD1]MBQ4801889.1 hypothetical protein [Aquimarina sp. MMG015]RKN32515.1 hypothetical protein D7035_05475 [Aquimarina sp. AD1]